MSGTKDISGTLRPVRLSISASVNKPFISPATLKSTETYSNVLGLSITPSRRTLGLAKTLKRIQQSPVTSKIVQSIDVNLVKQDEEMPKVEEKLKIPLKELNKNIESVEDTVDGKPTVDVVLQPHKVEKLAEEIEHTKSTKTHEALLEPILIQHTDPKSVTRQTKRNLFKTKMVNSSKNANEANKIDIKDEKDIKTKGKTKRQNFSQNTKMWADGDDFASSESPRNRISTDFKKKVKNKVSEKQKNVAKKSTKNKIYTEDSDDDFIIAPKKKLRRILSSQNNSCSSISHCRVELEQLTSNDLNPEEKSDKQELDSKKSVKNTKMHIEDTDFKIAPKRTLSFLNSQENSSSFVSECRVEFEQLTSNDENPQLKPYLEENDLKVLRTKICEMDVKLKEKLDTLDKLKQSKLYRSKHSLKDLKDLTTVWKNGAEQALRDLLVKLQEIGTISMEEVLRKIQGTSLFTYDNINDSFVWQ